MLFLIHWHFLEYIVAYWELLYTHNFKFYFQYTLMTEIREIVAIEDRVKFDELVYRRDIESSRIRDPREHDYRHSRVRFEFFLLKIILFCYL